KDEYEVARLLTDPGQLAAIRSRYAPGVRLRFHLAPPMLARRDPRTGNPTKMSFGDWILPFLRLLARGKRLRGTAFDPFGRTAERRKERASIGSYCADMEHCLAMLSPDNRAVVIELARLPMRIRGYGHVKEKARIAAEAERERLLAQLAVRQP